MGWLGCFGWFLTWMLAGCSDLSEGGGLELASDGNVDIWADKLAHLRFGVVGDTRPSIEDDTAGYPVAVIQQIWADIESEKLAFAVTTGDYVFARPWGYEAYAQIELYQQARARYRGIVFPAMGNHECSGATRSNCGFGEANQNFEAFLTRMLAPLGVSRPYYEVHFDSLDGTWTAKLIVLAANAWSEEQAQWMESALRVPTTYTFVVRHEPERAVLAPGVMESTQILDRHAYTLLLVGHQHTVRWHAERRELVVGNGGAPLTSEVGFGYVLVAAEAQAVRVEAHEAGTRALVRAFAVNLED